jgi:hypothetical protein
MTGRASSTPVVTISSVLVVAALVGFAVPAEAQRLDITPFGGWRFGGSFEELSTNATRSLDDAISYGLIVGIPWNAQDRSRLELVWSHQDTSLGLSDPEQAGFDVDVDYLHIGGMAPFRTPNQRLEALLTGGLGATFLRPGLSGASSETRFSLSLGVGLLYHVSDRVGLRLEARGWFTFTESSGAVFCAGGCVVAFSGSGFGQGELTAGLRFAF